jgi:hypothetical protein
MGMKKFGMQSVPFHVDSRILPSPFPGKHPIRWKVDIRYPVLVMLAHFRGRIEWKRYSYFGKPSVEVSEKVTKITSNYGAGHGGHIKVGELDRRGMFRFCHYTFPFSAPLSSNRLLSGTGDNTRSMFYGYLRNPDSGLLDWFQEKVYRKKIRYKKKVYTMYSSSSTLKKQEIEKFKSWLDFGGVLNG